MANRGTAFERRIAKACAIYHDQNRAKLEKVDPPSITFRGRTRLLPNPFLDFTGTWTERQGRTLIIEAKRTDSKANLPIARHGGITEKQWANLLDWERSGAATFILWERETPAHPFDLRILTTDIILQALREQDRVSVPWTAGVRVPRGKGHLIFDWLTTAQSLTTAPESVTKGTERNENHPTNNTT